MYWKVQGTFPSVGAMRRTGTTVIIEDVAFRSNRWRPPPRPAGTCLLRRHGYHEAIIFGHAWRQPALRVSRISATPPKWNAARFMDDVCRLVVEKYDGSLKAEHGTGRNMAPFVELEWGRGATDLMRRIKRLFDPENRLNPGVILNDDPRPISGTSSPLPAAEDRRGPLHRMRFLRTPCPPTPDAARQRIVGWRELSRRTAAGESPGPAAADFAYQGLDTCAGCGLCSTARPVGIGTPAN